MQITLNNILLNGQVPDEQVDMLDGDSLRDVQTVKPIGSDGSFPIDRGNEANAIQFMITRTHDSVVAAQYFVLNQLATMPRTGALKLTPTALPGEQPQTGFSSLYAVLYDVKWKFDGVTSTLVYHLKTGQLTPDGAPLPVIP